jgi:hypothetical protein
MGKGVKAWIRGPSPRMPENHFRFVITGLGPVIYAFLPHEQGRKGVDTRAKPAHDG